MEIIMTVRGICFQGGVMDDLTYFELEQTPAVAIYHTRTYGLNKYTYSVTLYRFYFQAMHYIMNTS